MIIMIITTSVLSDKLREYNDAAGKIMRMCRDGELFPLTRGIYETDRNAPGYCIAGAMFGPSYLSFDYALAYYGLIPEAVCTYSSATFNKRKTREIRNAFGTFTYRDVPGDAFPFGVVLKEEDGYVYRMASPEKALCDKLYTMPPVTSRKEIVRMLFEDLRIDQTEFGELDKSGILQIAGKYRCNNLKYLAGYLERRAV